MREGSIPNQSPKLQSISTKIRQKKFPYKLCVKKEFLNFVVCNTRVIVNGRSPLPGEEE